MKVNGWWIVPYIMENKKKVKPPTSVPIIILCLVYAYHPIMVHHIKSLGGGWGFDFGMCFTCFTSAAPSTIPWEPEQNGWTPTSAYKIVPARQSCWLELGAWLSYDGSRPLYNLTLMICSFTSINRFQPWKVIRVFWWLLARVRWGTWCSSHPSGCLMSMDAFCCAAYPHICWLPGLVNKQFAIENGHL